MAQFRPGSGDQAAFLTDLLAAGLLIETIVPGIYGRDATFEAIRNGLDGIVGRYAAEQGAESLRFPPVLPRKHVETTGYLDSFPHLMGAVFSFDGDEKAARRQAERARAHEDWSEDQAMTDLVLTPAVCYPIYPAIAARGPLAPGGVMVDVGSSYAFRHEPSGDPARMQMFHQRELVRLGEPEVVQEWRDGWRDRAVSILRGLGLDADFDVAADPFFGRAGRLMAASQVAQQLKFEILVPITEPEKTACASFNYHEDHFSGAHGVTMADGGPAHTACLGFGSERITLALLRTHGLDPASWPAEVREQLELA